MLKNVKLTELENEIPDVSNLVKKYIYNDSNTKVTEIENKLTDHNHDKYIDTSEFNKLAGDVFNARIAQANLIAKTDFDAKLSSFNRRITQNKTKHLFVENELIPLKIKYLMLVVLLKKQIITLKLLKSMINLLKLEIHCSN